MKINPLANSSMPLWPTASALLQIKVTVWLHQGRGKKTCMGSSADTKPNFSATEAYSHYANVANGATPWYNTPENPGLPVWINKVMLSPSPDEMPFDHQQ